MPAITRKDDLCTGHDLFLPRKALTGSDNVFVNGKAVHREGDEWEIHCAGSSCHVGKLDSGSGSVFINGKACGRIGDPIDCGSFVDTGSSNVFAG